MLKNFNAWLKGLSVKTTILLTGIGITLFIAMQQALIGSMASGISPSDIFAMSFTLWFSVMVVTIVFSAFLLLIGYAGHKLKARIKSKISNKKRKKQ
ncbi:hypothetical protein [Staphylococcus equorum]|uniref:Uncharacterized protein n=1 Tax=Staphylococcus equorum TaxID=246432 RepID=A0AAP7LUX4_9STAP|nr:hypothetical protein [Staphylococcus equorum]OEK58877.1 hypothetical protein ASS94_00720 [Staphylococcus equorum]